MLLQQFQQHLKEDFPHLSPANNKFILAVSGGIDSVVLTDLFYKSGYDFIIAHCNFQLRGEESLRDELFMTTLKEKYNREVIIQQFNTKQYAEDNKISIQEAARKLRYDWFSVISHQLSAISFTAIAHNADDNIETMLMYLFRGTGIHGLTGMQAYDKARKIIRPLLFATRKQIAAYAEENNLGWVEDSSNLQDKYTRNFFRHNIIPLAEAQFENTRQNLQSNIQRFKDVAILYEQSVETHKKKLIEQKGNEIHIPILKLQQTQPLDTVLWEIIKPYNFHAQQLAEIKKLFDAANSSYVQSSTHRIIKNRNHFIIAPIETSEANHILIEANDKQVKFENGMLMFEKLSATSYQLSAGSNMAQMDESKIEYPLLLRKWKQGDYFYPLGMKKKKKLSRFFIDLKLSATAKENAWVIEMNKKIIWVIGYRIDERFKITPSTQEVLKISFTAAQER
ncbi:tRNA lysidine(34) synthetase TilS [Parafilimonas terrae]|uniref:tRNA(Ile)-lysidine synthase n=1 Tax=Parafilimonas terrae TaxID=1465490 RepID=A0A1I5RUY6_9BACT|nr:tRNA lysidine(34) synthetase TilS [Parafilimonas terrae]SFP62227.1 tRNA(Ile)-lysidine synthase [Parafilimonas terrae]